MGEKNQLPQFNLTYLMLYKGKSKNITPHATEQQQRNCKQEILCISGSKCTVLTIITVMIIIIIIISDNSELENAKWDNEWQIKLNKKFPLYEKETIYALLIKKKQKKNSSDRSRCSSGALIMPHGNDGIPLPTQAAAMSITLHHLTEKHCCMVASHHFIHQPNTHTPTWIQTHICTSIHMSQFFHNLSSSLIFFFYSSLFSAHVYFYPSVHGRSQRNDEAWETCSSPWQLYCKPSLSNIGLSPMLCTSVALISLLDLFRSILYPYFSSYALCRSYFPGLSPPPDLHLSMLSTPHQPPPPKERIELSFPPWTNGRAVVE